MSFSYSLDGSLSVTGGEDGKVKIWSYQNSFCIVTFTEHSSGVSDVCFTQNGKVILSASLGGSVRAHDIKRYRNFCTLIAPKQTQLNCLCSDSSGELLSNVDSVSNASEEEDETQLKMPLYIREVAIEGVDKAQRRGGSNGIFKKQKLRLWAEGHIYVEESASKKFSGVLFSLQSKKWALQRTCTITSVTEDWDLRSKSDYVRETGWPNSYRQLPQRLWSKRFDMELPVKCVLIFQARTLWPDEFEIRSSRKFSEALTMKTWSCSTLLRRHWMESASFLGFTRRRAGQHYNSNLDVRKTRSSATKDRVAFIRCHLQEVSARILPTVLHLRSSRWEGSADCVGMDAEEVKGGVSKNVACNVL
uniref:Uncharacterized protein n=1 Tax=Ditylenchus dipsaci TaxID=166011 RepID=A0A915DFR2_9BILA